MSGVRADRDCERGRWEWLGWFCLVEVRLWGFWKGGGRTERVRDEVGISHDAADVILNLFWVDVRIFCDLWCVVRHSCL